MALPEINKGMDYKVFEFLRMRERVTCNIQRK